jgi:CrcB protein
MRRFDRQELAAIFAGGAIGAIARVWLSQRYTQGDTSWPWTIFAINISGSFALAYFATRLQERLPQSTYRRPALGTGLCGAYTTFSTMEVEILKMVEGGRYGLAVAYGVASIAAGLLSIWLATTIVRRARLA